MRAGDAQKSKKEREAYPYPMVLCISELLIILLAPVVNQVLVRGLTD